MRRGVFALLVLGLLAASVVGSLVLNVQIAVGTAELTAVEEGNAELRRDVQRLEDELLVAQAPAELATRAAGAGLVPAAPAAFLVLATDGGATLRGSAVPAPTPPPSPASSARSARSADGG